MSCCYVYICVPVCLGGSIVCNFINNGMWTDIEVRIASVSKPCKTATNNCIACYFTNGCKNTQRDDGVAVV